MCCKPGLYAQVLLFLLPLILLPTIPAVVRNHNKALQAEEVAGISVGIYAAIINVLAWLMFGLDKCFAMNDEWRIAEAGLWLTIFEGGVVGGWLGVCCFSHKTSKGSFLCVATVLSILGMGFLGGYYGVLYTIFK